MKKLYRNGVALSVEELAVAPSFIGSLVIKSWSRSQDATPTKKAQLLDMSRPTLHPSVTQPLFEPVLVRMTHQQMMLQGYEIHTDGETITHFAQCWVLQSPRD
ncbi:MAG TPA: hypothetical protein VNS29_15410 [Burkholderiaceae bacterium]|nr:hypothetical protein [Burkholderiaceae bacterium]